MNIYCNNCGSTTHISRNCRNPVTSYGVLLFRLDNKIPKILMINRKDSLCYIDFLRGKYSINNYKYIQILIDKCSLTEKKRLIQKEYIDLWKELWVVDELNEKFTNDFTKGEEKFNKLKEGFFCSKLNKDIDINYFVKNSKTNYSNSEWEFPKGRRNNYESNKDCAVRELEEETGYNNSDYELIINIKPYSENYVGENKVRYKHIYYIGQLLNNEKETSVDKNNLDQFLEVSDIKWLSNEECLNYIRQYHKTRKIIINNIFTMIDNLDDYLLI